MTIAMCTLASSSSSRCLPSQLGIAFWELFVDGGQLRSGTPSPLLDVSIYSLMLWTLRSPIGLLR